jgi:hypothetical protein
MKDDIEKVTEEKGGKEEKEKDNCYERNFTYYMSDIISSCLLVVGNDK